MRKHGQLARTRQQIYDERVFMTRNLGTYKTGVAILGQGDRTTTNTQQSSTFNTISGSRNKTCNNCGKQGHKTWRAKSCTNHHLYLQSKKAENTSKTISHLTKIGNREENVRKKNRKQYPKQRWCEESAWRV